MSAIQTMTCAPSTLVTRINGSQQTLNPVLVPASTIAAAQTYLNNTYLPTLHDASIQMVAHVFAISPLRFAVFTANAGISIPASWWLSP